MLRLNDSSVNIVQKGFTTHPPVAYEDSPAEGGRSLPTALFSPHRTTDPIREGLLRSWEDALTPPARITG